MHRHPASDLTSNGCWPLAGPGNTAGNDDVILLLIDELQHAYPTPEQRSAHGDLNDQLWTYIKRLALGDARARRMPLRIVAAAVYGDAPSYGAAGSASTGLLHSNAGTPFEIGLDRQVRLHRSEPDQPALTYTVGEYDELWAATWGDHQAELFSGTVTKMDILWVTAGQVRNNPLSSYNVKLPTALPHHARCCMFGMHLHGVHLRLLLHRQV